MPAVSLSRVGARVVESGPDGQELAAGAWQKLEALPDPRSPRGRVYPLACLIAVALCAFTAAGNDRLTAVGRARGHASTVTGGPDLAVSTQARTRLHRHKLTAAHPAPPGSACGRARIAARRHLPAAGIPTASAASPLRYPGRRAAALAA